MEHVLSALNCDICRSRKETSASVGIVISSSILTLLEIQSQFKQHDAASTILSHRWPKYRSQQHSYLTCIWEGSHTVQSQDGDMTSDNGPEEVNEQVSRFEELEKLRTVQQPILVMHYMSFAFLHLLRSGISTSLTDSLPVRMSFLSCASFALHASSTTDSGI